VSTLFARTLLTLELCLAIRLPPVRTSAHSARLNQKDSLVASLDLAAFASIPSGKKNSRGAWHLRQIDGVYGVLQQVRRGVTGRRRACAAERGGRDGIRTRLIAAEFFLAQDVTGAIRAPRLRSERCMRRMNASSGHHFDRADRALTQPQDQVTTMQQILTAGHRVFRRHLAVVQVRTALRNRPPGR
jgi:hypothetical protein